MPRRRSKPYHHGDLRQAALACAHEAITASGVEGLSLRHVARSVGVSATALYHHFDTKVDLLAALAIEGFEQLDRRLDDAAAQGGDTPKSKLAAMASAYVHFAVEDPARYQVMFWSGFDDEQSDLRAVAKSSFDRLAQAVADLAPSPEDVTARALAAWSTAHGMATLWTDGLLTELDADAASLDALTQRTGQLIAAMVES